MRKLLTIVFALSLYQLYSQAPGMVFTDALQLTVTGRAFNRVTGYDRVDTIKYNTIPAAVKKLLTNPAGMAITFTTNSNTISARWTMNAAARGLPNMTAIASSGLDLYIKLNKTWVFAGTGVPRGTTTEATLVTAMENGEKECLLYLPLYNAMDKLEIGVTAGSNIQALSNPFTNTIVVYGSSITQGASACRPGLAYPAQLARQYGYNFINLGLSGNGKMEPEVAGMIADINADVFILDCAANPTADEIYERTNRFVKIIRSKHPVAPIVMIQSVVREGGTFNVNIRGRVAAQNKAFKDEFEKLIKDGITNLHIIESVNFLGTDHEGTIDGTHPTDVGFSRFIEAIIPKLMPVIEGAVQKK